MAGSGVSSEKGPGSGGGDWNDYIVAGGAVIAQHVMQPDGNIHAFYLHYDRLGSVTVITNDAAQPTEYRSYDAWGKLRNTNGTDDPSGAIATGAVIHAFTGQEHLDDVNLVHLNGRVYDPTIGRFLSADPFVQDPLNSQSFNRYSYVVNNPLTLTDPTGYFFLEDVFEAVFLPSALLIRKVPFFATFFEIAAPIVLCPTGGGCAIAVAFLSTAYASGLQSGDIGEAFKSGFIAAASAAAFQGVGDATNFHGVRSLSEALDRPADFALNIAGHALIGCASAVASSGSGGSCGPGALSAGTSAAAAPALGKVPFGSPEFFRNVAISATLGGVTSVAVGGKFENGAITASYGYLFNAAAGRIAGSLLGGTLAGAGGAEGGPADFFAIVEGVRIGGEFGSAIEDAIGQAIASINPTNSGFFGDPVTTYLYPGDRIDRFGGSIYSDYFSPVGTPAEMRSLPPGRAGEPLRTFEILKPLPVQSGLVAPAYGQPGLGQQYKTPVPLGTLIDRGIVREIR